MGVGVCRDRARRIGHRAAVARTIRWEEHDTVPDFTVTFPAIGNRWLVGIAFLVHITTVAFIIGIAMVAPVAEILGRRPGGERWLQLAHQISTVIERLFAWGATWAALALVAIWGLYPRLWGYLTSLYFIQVLIIAGLLWFLMAITAYVYYSTWEPLHGRWLLHNAIGWPFTISSMAFITLIVMFSAQLLTPVGSPNDLLAAAFNPGYIAEEIHRQVGNLSYGALLLGALLAASLLVFSGRLALEQHVYRRWVIGSVVVLGLIVTLLQPLTGWYYVLQVQAISYGAWELMMAGANGWMFLIQIGLLGAAFFLGSLYLALGVPTADERNPGWEPTWLRWSLLPLGLALLLAVVPKEFPLGLMRPWKYLALGTYLVVTIANLLVYRRARRRAGPVPGGWHRPAVAAALGIVLVTLFIMMGIIRESARGPWLIYEKMPPQQAQELLRP